MTAKSTDSEEVIEGEYNTVSTDPPSHIVSAYWLICHFQATLASEQLFLSVQAKNQKRFILILIVMGKMVFYGFDFFSFATNDHMT